MTRLVSPTSLAEAVELLAAEPQLCPIAGCTDLMVRDALARARLEGVLDLLRVPELRGVRADEQWIEIGAATTFSELRADPLVVELLPGLAAAAAVVGGWQIQNRATIGGNVVNASPAGDSLPVLLALEARAVAVGGGGEREIPFTSFHTGYRQTALAPGELLARLRIPVPEPGTRQLFQKVGTRRAQAISKVVVCLVGRIEGGRCVDYRLAAGSVAAVPLRLASVEREVVGRALSAEVANEAGDLAAAAVDPIDDVRSTAEYRSWVLGRVVRRLTRKLGAAEGRD